ncbi:GNAT family N-acetyltransferase [Tabrizicola sp.]|uniref:GNAT family N-acetyltransferase n=1 Tax=Tabrizicola sp. TaxID=2005166 RepID=UPI00286CF6B8|nr:GNAT family N-acetyltransferase [Tabrizicola sp.]
MLIAMTDQDFAELVAGKAPRDLRLPDSDLAPKEVIAMLRDLARSIAADFEPAAWMMVEGSEIIGLCSLVSPPADRQMRIGYGVAPTRGRQGAATRAVADLVTWARADGRIDAIGAETGADNLPSQKVLVRNGFHEVGRRTDPEDGALICWTVSTGS